MAFDERLHRRDHRGRFSPIADAAAAGDAGGRAADVRVGGAGGRRRDTPRIVSPAEFDRLATGGTLWRGTNGADAKAAADASRAGKAGGGDYGDGIYVTRSADLAVGYSQQHQGDNRGVVLRVALDPGARIATQDDLPRTVRGSDIGPWMRKHGYDVYQQYNVTLIVNPGVMVVDRKNYTADEATNMDARAKGYTT